MELWDLNTELVSSPFVTVAYPPWRTPASTAMTTSEFDSMPRMLPLNTQSVLYIIIYLDGDLPTSSLARSLLLPVSIGLSPLYPALPAICRSATVRSSTQLSPGFKLARNRSIGFRSPTIDYGRAHPVPRLATADLSVSLRLRGSTA